MYMQIYWHRCEIAVQLAHQNICIENLYFATPMKFFCYPYSGACLGTIELVTGTTYSMIWNITIDHALLHMKIIFPNFDF